jgi:hypothetical protein
VFQVGEKRQGNARKSEFNVTIKRLQALKRVKRIGLMV